MITFKPGEIATRDLHQHLLGIVAPRPIAFASTINSDGVANLAPYSFFNAFSSNPPIVVFSSNRRVLNNTTKDTLRNIKESGEVVINAVSHSIIRQMAICSVEWDEEESEFEKSGLQPLPSEYVKPPRVLESPAHMECKVNEIITLGQHGGAGHLIICEVLCIHIDEKVMEGNRIDPHKMDLMGRMGRAYYVRASGEAIHTIVQPVLGPAIGWDNLPESIRTSSVLSGNDIATLAGQPNLPSKEECDELMENEDLQNILNSNNSHIQLHNLIKRLIEADDIPYALNLAMVADSLHNKKREDGG